MPPKKEKQKYDIVVKIPNPNETSKPTETSENTNPLHQIVEEMPDKIIDTVKTEPAQELPKCDKCEKTFRSQTGLKFHLMACTFTLITEAKKESRNEKTQETENSEEEIDDDEPEDILSKNTSTEPKTEFHQENVYKTEEKSMNHQKSAEEEGKSVKDSPSKSSEMDSNALSSKTTEILDYRHLKIFICPSCEKSFSRNSNLKTHITISHKGGTKLEFSCQICEKSFSRKSNLNSHLNIEHEGNSTNIDKHSEFNIKKEAFKEENSSTFLSPQPNNSLNQNVKDLPDNLIANVKTEITEEIKKEVDDTNVNNGANGSTNDKELSNFSPPIAPQSNSLKQIIKDIPDKIIVKTETPEEIPKCNKCNKTFRSQSGLKFHLIACKTAEIKGLENFEEKSNIQENNPTHNEANQGSQEMEQKSCMSFICKSCDQSYTQPQELQDHINR